MPPAGGGSEERPDSLHPWGLEVPPTTELTSHQAEPQLTGVAVALLPSPLLYCLACVVELILRGLTTLESFWKLSLKVSGAIE